MITKAILSSVIALAVGGALCDRAPAQTQYTQYQPQYAPYQQQYAPAQPQYAPAQQQYAPAQTAYGQMPDYCSTNNVATGAIVGSLFGAAIGGALGGGRGAARRSGPGLACCSAA